MIRTSRPITKMLDIKIKICLFVLAFVLLTCASMGECILIEIFPSLSINELVNMYVIKGNKIIKLFNFRTI